jgi:hypothetical protein
MGVASKQGMKACNAQFQHYTRTGARALGALFVLVLVASPAQPDRVSHAVAWKGIAPQYAHFNQIRPVLMNTGKSSIFLSRIWPHGSAQLQRFNEANKTWETGAWSGGCGTVKDASVPIKLAAHSDHPIDVLWQLSTDDWDAPTHFVVGSRHTRPLAGKYRLLLRYSQKPWTVGHTPGIVYVTNSPEFSVAE